MEIALGVDIGGTTTAFGLVDKSGTILWERVVATRDYSDARNLVETIHKNVCTQLSENHRLVGIGIGAPNGNVHTGCIEFAPNLHWRGSIPLAAIIQDIFDLPCTLTNDANAAAYGELLFGCAQDLSDFVSITLGTGVGSGIIVNKQLVYGAHGMAGEYGHIRVVPNGRKCGCGRRGCLETYASSTGVVRSIAELSSDNAQISALRWLENPTAKAVFELANDGDLFAMEIVDYTAEVLGGALADFAAFSDPQAYVLFGGIAQSGKAFADKVKAVMDNQLLNIYQNKVEVRISSLHDTNAAVLGASAIAFGRSN